MFSLFASSSNNIAFEFDSQSIAEDFSLSFLTSGFKASTTSGVKDTIFDGIFASDLIEDVSYESDIVDSATSMSFGSSQFTVGLRKKEGETVESVGVVVTCNGGGGGS